MNKLYLAEKETGDVYAIYDISYNKNGYPHFLVYKDGQWMRMSAKHFKPVPFFEPAEPKKKPFWYRGRVYEI